MSVINWKRQDWRKNKSESRIHSGGSRISQRGRQSLRGGGLSTYYLTIFSRKLHGNVEILTRGDASPWRLLVDPPMRSPYSTTHQWCSCLLHNQSINKCHIQLMCMVDRRTHHHGHYVWIHGLYFCHNSGMSIFQIYQLPWAIRVRSRAVGVSNTFIQTQVSLGILRNSAQVQTQTCPRPWVISVNNAYLSFTTERRELKHEKYICIKRSKSFDTRHHSWY